jgi:hypothetical protein
MKIPWNNQACAKCGVTAELHRSDPSGYVGGPMLPKVWDCFEFVWSEVNFQIATQMNEFKSGIKKSGIHQTSFGAHKTI